MKILMIHPHDIFSPREPWTRRIRCIAKNFVEKGHSVKLVFFPVPGKLKPKAASLSAGYEISAFDRSSSPIVFLKNIGRMIRLARWADVIHVQKCHHYASVPAIIASYVKNKPLHYDWDDWEEMIWYESCGRGLFSLCIGLLFRVLERCMLYLADTVSVSSQCLNELALKYGLTQDRIYHAPVGADLEEFNPFVSADSVRKKYNIRDLVVFYVGQLHGAQYLEQFIRSASMVLHKNNRVVFMIVGEGCMENVLKKLTMELGIENKVIFTGSVPPRDVPGYIGCADICVAPFSETAVTMAKSPLKIVEYMAMGKAVVASNVGEVRRMLGGVGVLTEPGSSVSLAEGILKLINENKLREKLGYFARQRAENRFNWEYTSTNLLTAYENAGAR